MPIKWKTTQIGEGRERVKITHWQKHDPRKLLAALEREPQREPGGNPPVLVYPFKKHLLAVRSDTPDEQAWFHSPEGVFEMLQATGERHAVLETPVALIEPASSKYGAKLVTLWKKHAPGEAHYNLQKFISMRNISNAAKRQAVKSAVGKLAKLHAQGYLHGHAHPRNFLVMRKNTANLIDPTKLQEDTRGIGPIEAEQFINYVEDHAHQIIDPMFRTELLNHYFATLNRFKK